MTRRVLQETLRKPIILGAIVGVVLIIAIWIFAFYAPEGRKLSSVQAEQISLRAQVDEDEAKVRQLSTVKQHYTAIKADETRLLVFVPTTDELYTYIQTINQAAKSSGVTISSVSPGAAGAVTGEPFNAIPVSISITGQYDSILKMVKAIYALPRLTDITAVNLSGGGPNSTRSTTLNAQLNLEIFYQVTPAPTTTTTTTTTATSS